MTKTLICVLLLPGAVLADVALFDDDPDHPWNRLHAALWLRQDAAGTTYGIDRLDPPLWRGSQHLLRGTSLVTATDALQEFLDTHADTLIQDPSHRAVLQRDLWSILDYAVGQADPLAARLARVMRRLALSSEVIRQLPDPYAATADLPPDLFDPGGPWVCLGRPDGPVAPAHSGVFPRSVFLVYLSLPDGRDGTLDYLEQVRRHRTPSFSLPQLPAGTRVALVRRAILVDEAGRPTPSPITIQLQLRVFRQVPVVTSELQRRAMFTHPEGVAEEQEVSELVLSRQTGKLVDAGADLPSRFGSGHVADFLEVERPARYYRSALERCPGCHSLPGVYSVNTLYFFRAHLGSNGLFGIEELASLSATSPDVEGQKAVAELVGNVTWEELRKLWAK